MLRWSCAVVQLVDAGVVLAAGVGLVWPNRLPAEINKAHPTANPPDGKIKERGKLFIGFRMSSCTVDEWAHHSIACHPIRREEFHAKSYGTAFIVGPFLGWRHCILGGPPQVEQAMSQ